MDGPCTPFDLADPTALAGGLDDTRGGEGEVWLTVAPQEQPVLERKGLLGRRKQEPAGWCVAAQDWSRRRDPAEWTIWMTVPKGQPLSRRGIALPPGAEVETESDVDALLRLPSGTDAAIVAAELCRFAAALIAPTAPGGWFWRVGDTFLPYYRIEYWDV